MKKRTILTNFPVRLLVLRKRFESYTNEELKLYNGENEETLKFWNRKDAIEEALETCIDEGYDLGLLIIADKVLKFPGILLL